MGETKLRFQYFKSPFKNGRAKIKISVLLKSIQEHGARFRFADGFSLGYFVAFTIEKKISILCVVVWWISEGPLIIIGPPWCLHTEEFFRNLKKSTRNQIVFIIFRLIWIQTDVRLDPNLSENGKYNLISVWFDKISVCVHQTAKTAAIRETGVSRHHGSIIECPGHQSIIVYWRGGLRWYPIIPRHAILLDSACKIFPA